MIGYNKTGAKYPHLGPRQLKCLKLIAKRPGDITRAEIGRKMRINAVSAHLLINKLVAAGLVDRQWRRPRGVWPTKLDNLALLI